VIAVGDFHTAEPFSDSLRLYEGGRVVKCGSGARAPD
jgi:hypothetical protein